MSSHTFATLTLKPKQDSANTLLFGARTTGNVVVPPQKRAAKVFADFFCGGTTTLPVVCCAL